MEAKAERAERTLTLLTSTYLANTDAVRTNIGLVVDTVLSQNLLAYIDATELSEDTAKRYASAIHRWLARINSLATGKTSESRMAGILLMKHTTLQSPQTFADNVSKWTTTLLNVLGKAETTPVLVATLQTLLTFIDAVRDVPVLHREIATAQVPRMNQAVLGLVDKSIDLVDQGLDVLAYSAAWFPTLFRPSIDKTEALCLRILDGSRIRSDPKLCRQAATCMASLCLVGGKSSAEERWFYCMQQALGSISQCIDHIMCTDTVDDKGKVGQHFSLPAFADDFVVSIPQAADRIAAMVELLVGLLVHPTHVDISVPINDLIQTASGLAMIPMRAASSKSNRAEFDLIPLLSPQIQRAAIRIMAALAISMGGHMYPFLSMVARAVVAINVQHIQSPATQVALHSLIQLYIEKYGYGFIVHLPYEVVSSAVDDTGVHRKVKAPPSSESATTPTTSQSKKRSGNGKQRASGYGEADDAGDTSRIHWTDVVYAALKTVLALLRHTPTILSTPLRIKIDSQVLTLQMLDMIGGINTPFAARQSDTRYRVVLFQCLEASILSPDPWQKAILPHVISAMKAGLADSSNEVRSVCQHTLMCIEPIIHSRLPAQKRRPDKEENLEIEDQVPQMMRATGSSVSISAVLSSTHLNEQHVVAEVNVDSAIETSKRFKHEDASTELPTVLSQKPNLDLDPQDAPLDSKQQRIMPEEQSILTHVTKPATEASYTSVAFRRISTDNSSPRVASATQTRITGKASGSTEDASYDDDNDDIPDIVMEGSDSEDD
ncbi:hypothetical protein COEREDRAFT_88691 [Coemansia reversa NRRL 1564]|uniref:Pre-rRNA-processing protein RIX1 n=1 Tax=Coemansia reversa (strain ATCC 12441 / NRRL 1564) TaxID=763665 RepID=A0A2G5B626_COERN|nr:hypothetical protein COEREDRAFT_88691 [Coemansia reversa NRRL 1564]|eukprot:PIA14451.1 hypothetical protein COEREDRAFT_88691 [Coemansia reversa NRRL 1564]